MVITVEKVIKIFKRISDDNVKFMGLSPIMVYVQNGWFVKC